MIDRLKSLFIKTDQAPAIPNAEGRSAIPMSINSMFNQVAPTALFGHSSLEIPIVYACIKVIRETTASLDRHILKKSKEGVYKPDFNHFSNDLIAKPNSYMSFTELLMLWQSNYLIRGNSFIVPHRDRHAKTIQLHWRPDAAIYQYQDAKDGEIYYHDRETNIIYHSNNIAHLKDIWDNPFWGRSRLDRASKTTGKIKATNDLVNKLSTSGLLMGGAVIYPESVRDDGKLQEQERYFNMVNGGGVENAGRWQFLHGGPSIHQFKMDMNLTEAQIIPASHLAIEDICRLFSTPPHKVQHLVKASYNSFEHLQINFMQDAIKPDARLMAEQLSKLLFLPSEQSSYKIKFESETLDMADTMQTISALSQAVTNGLLNHDEARAKMGLSPLPNGTGKKHYFASNNMSPIEEGKINNDEK